MNQSLAFAPDGTPYVAYQDKSVANDFRTTVMRYNGVAWENVGIARFSAGQANYQSLSFAPDGTPYVAYQDQSVANDFKTTVMRYNGAAWEYVGIARFSNVQAEYQSLSFAPDGTPYVAHKEILNGNKTTVMRLVGTAGAPTAVTALAGNGQATVSFTPASDGGSAITSYAVTAIPGGAGCTPTLPATSCVVSGLSNGTDYTFTVVATNAVGASPVSPASTVVTPVATMVAAPTSIPTLSAWGLVLMSGLLALQALVLQRKTR